MQQGEYYSPKPIAAGAVVQVGSRVAGFLCKTAGSLTLTDFGGNIVVDTFPVVVGFNRIAVFFSYPQGNTVTSVTAVGTLLL